jgi:GT2 family glycosyltransferase
VTRPAPAVSVVVLTYNSRESIDQCLSAVFAQSFTDFEVIVVDNASTDGGAEVVRQQFPCARLIVSPTNGGYGAGNNLGASHALGGTLVFLNPDAVPEPEWLANLIGGMRTHGRRLATSKIVLQSDPGRLNSGGNLIHYLGLSYCRGLNAGRSTFDAPELVSGASGAACAISRDLFERIGGFDPEIFLYHDDVDLSLRSLLAGERCQYVPSAVVAHDYDLTVPPIKWGWIEAYRYAVLLKAFRLRTLLVLSPALLLIDVITLAFLAARGPAFITAKLNTYAWLARHARAIGRRRRYAQATRRVSDHQMLQVLTDQIPYEQLAQPGMASAAHAVLDPPFRLYKSLALCIVRW